MQGYLNLVGSRIKSQKKRYIILIQKQLEIYKTKKEYEANKPPKQIYKINGYTVSVYEPRKKKKKDRKFYFRLTHKQFGTINFSTHDRSNGIQWLKCFKSCNQKTPRTNNLPTYKPKLHLLDNLGDFKFLKTNYLLSKMAKANKIFFQGTIVYKDPQNFYFDEFFCTLTQEKLILLPQPKVKEIRNEIDTKIEIEVSNIELICLTSDNDDQYKITIKIYNETPKYLTSDNVVTVLIIYHILQFLNHPDFEDFLKNGPIQTTEQIYHLFCPLICKIFEITSNFKQKLSDLQYPNLEKTQSLWFEKIVAYFSQKIPLQIISQSNSNSQSLQSLIIILCLILWLLPDPIFNYDFNQFEELYNPSDTLTEIIKKFVKNFQSCKPITQEILGCVFLITHTLWNDLNSPILKKFAQFFSNIIHFVKIGPSNTIEEQILYSKKNNSYIIFIITNAPILFNNTLSSNKNCKMFQNLNINEEYHNMVKEIYPTLQSQNNTLSKIKYNNNNFNVGDQKVETVIKIKTNIERVKSNELPETKKEKVRTYSTISNPQISGYIQSMNRSKSCSMDSSNLHEKVTIQKSLSHEEVTKIDVNGNSKQSEISKANDINPNPNKNLYLTQNQTKEKLGNWDQDSEICSENEIATDMEEETQEESYVNKLYHYYDKTLPLLPRNEFHSLRAMEETEEENYFPQNKLEPIMDIFSEEMKHLDSAFDYLLLLKNPNKLQKENLQQYQLFEKILDIISFEMITIGLDITQDYSEFSQINETILSKFCKRNTVKAPILEQLNIPLNNIVNDDQLALKQFNKQNKGFEKLKNKNRFGRKWRLKQKTRKKY
ncbi:hypothetical protein M0812_11461 [Anaeramoeba flamelloides]|uniref:PH domain-containing protein n=1 Tax=Anaeramoeba flamelloides TaxID=1746091 RepID=A0AAV7ZWK3_9EUKA|nr:hypothetical protein M0812_11461 [Anaeramoeba flamelloides]